MDAEFIYLKVHGKGHIQITDKLHDTNYLNHADNSKQNNKTEQ